MDRAFWTHVFLFVHVMGAIAALGPTVLVILAIAVYAPAFQRQLALADAIASDPADATAAADYRAAARTSRIIGATVGGLTVLVVFFMVWKPNLW
jgi:hypothetical protein